MPAWQEYLDANQERFLSELCDLIRIPSISALPANAADVQRAAEWVAARLGQAGLERPQVLPTQGHPVAYAEWLHAPGQPTVLIYGHFDTQPVDPLDLWDHPPFEPTIVGDRLYARGATDDKGNMLAPIAAVEALLRTEGRLPVNVKFLAEGQEEIGSPHLPPFIASHKELLACDLVLSADGGQWSETKPNLVLSLRGICALQIDLLGPERDLHSGSFGGAVQNPIHALVRLLDSMRAPDGRITIDGFYDGVVELTADERRALNAVPFDEAEYCAELGVPALFGEAGYTPRERTWIRPTLEINGIWGGFQGEGSKTVLPSQAHAKITCRLVAHQDPARVVAAIERHVAQHAPAGVRTQVRIIERGTPAYLIPADHAGLAAAREVLTDMFGVMPYYVREGGSIPICTLLRQHLGAYTVMFGFGLDDERTHSPNEFFRLSSFRKAQRAYGLMLARLARKA